MLVTAENNRRNRNHALVLTGLTAVATMITGWFVPPVLLGLAAR